jgi:hypothetical protein
MVSTKDSYYFTAPSQYPSTSNSLTIMRMRYKEINATVTPFTVAEYFHPSGQFASSTMWIDYNNTLWIAHGNIIRRVLSDGDVISNGRFNPAQVRQWTIPSPYIIDRALVDAETGKTYALCSKPNSDYVGNLTQYMCEIWCDPDPSVTTVSVGELSPLPTTIIDSDNKHINIPTKSNFIVIVAADTTRSCFDLTSNSWRLLSTLIDFEFDAYPGRHDLKISAITQPTFRSSSNYLTILEPPNTANNFSIWKLFPIINN